VFTSLIESVQAIEGAIEAGDYKQAADLLITFQRTMFDLMFGPKMATAATASASGAGGKAELKAAVGSAVKAAKKAQKEQAKAAKAPRKGVAAGEGGRVGKIGDGKILELLIQVLPTILHLFIK
jgi:hypothetical protein